MLFNIMVIIEIALFLLVVKNSSACKAIKSSHYSSKNVRNFLLGDSFKICPTSEMKSIDRISQSDCTNG